MMEWQTMLASSRTLILLQGLSGLVRVTSCQNGIDNLIMGSTGCGVSYEGVGKYRIDTTQLQILMMLLI
jgi:hypothetical protein